MRKCDKFIKIKNNLWETYSFIDAVEENDYVNHVVHELCL